MGVDDACAARPRWPRRRGRRAAGTRPASASRRVDRPDAGVTGPPVPARASGPAAHSTEYGSECHHTVSSLARQNASRPGPPRPRPPRRRTRTPPGTRGGAQRGHRRGAQHAARRHQDPETEAATLPFGAITSTQAVKTRHTPMVTPSTARRRRASTVVAAPGISSRAGTNATVASVSPPRHLAATRGRAAPRGVPA